MLLLPATLMKSANDKTDIYRYQSAFQGIIGVSINPGAVIEKFRITHIIPSKDAESAWKKECSGYGNTAKTACQKLLDGGEYCPPSNTYVPPYCYATSTIDTYIASTLWNYQRDFITRALYVGDTFYSLSESSIRSWNFSNTSSPVSSVTFASKPVKMPVYPMVMTK